MREKMTPELHEKILKACRGLRKKFGKRKWFREIRVGVADDKRTIFVTSDTIPSPRRAGQCIEYNGIPVIIIKEVVPRMELTRGKNVCKTKD